MTLLELADRCEKAEGPDRELDYAVSEGVGKGCVRREREVWRDYAEETGGLVIARYTASIDAALTLVPEGWSKSLYDADNGDGLCELNRESDDHEVQTRGKTWPLALCAAALKARANKETDHG